jgi:hypothetical protein
LVLVRRIVTKEIIYREERNMKAKFHYEAAAMAGHDGARNNLGYIEFNSGNKEQALKHIRIAAAAGQIKSLESREMRSMDRQKISITYKSKPRRNINSTKHQLLLDSTSNCSYSHNQSVWWGKFLQTAILSSLIHDISESAGPSIPRRYIQLALDTLRPNVPQDHTGL